MQEIESVPEPAVTDDPALILERQEEHRDIWRQIRSVLGPDQFGALWLKYQEELSIRDIARALNRTQTSVKVLLFRARQNLLRAAALWREKPQAETARGLNLRPGESGRPSSSKTFNFVKQSWVCPQPATNLSAEIK